MERMIGSLITDSALDEYRQSLDSQFHDQYVLRRRRIQNNIVRKMLSIVPISSMICDGSFFQMIVVVGPIGSGKSFLVQTLKKATENFFLHIDINVIRCELPECRRYQTQCPHLFANITQKESGAICELLIYAALTLHIPIILDSTIRDVAWHRKFFQGLKSKYPGLNIQMIHITASEESINRRIALRNQQACHDRVVFQHMVSESYQMLHSLEKFKEAFSDICSNIIGIDNTCDCRDSRNFEPKVIFPWHLNWKRVKYLLKIESPDASDIHRREYRLFQGPNTTASPVTENYATANECNFSNASTNCYTTALLESKASLNETYVSNNSYDTSLQDTASFSNFSNENLQSNEEKEEQEERNDTVYTNSWIIERLRLYHKPQNTNYCPHPSGIYPCFLCRVDKVPDCCQSLRTRSATLNSNTQEKRKSSNAKESYRLHTYPSIR